MKKLFIAAALLASVTLGGRASTLTKLQTAWSVVSSASVTPTQIIVAGNAFDALEATATQYLLYCKSVNYAPQPCALGNRKPVVAAVRSGRAARNQLETYAAQGNAGPADLYNTLTAAITSLQQSKVIVTGATK
jgi:hypothetical protein